MSEPSVRNRYSDRERRRWTAVRSFYEWVTVPVAIVALLSDRRIHAAYRMSWRRRFALGLRMFRNARQVPTATSFKAHLAMAATLLQVPPDTEGVVVECGCYQGGSTANLSLVCDLVDRTLVVYDSFEGMPPPKKGDRYALPTHEGSFCGSLEQVRANVERLGAPGRCVYRKGWFADTLPHHDDPVVLMFLDVDHQASLHDCLVHLWPHLVDQGYVFIDEYTRLDYCGVFFSERYFERYLQAPPPGLFGVGTGIPLGQYLLGPYPFQPPMQSASSIGWTRKDFRGAWTYFPDDAATGTAGPQGSASSTHDT